MWPPAVQPALLKGSCLLPSSSSSSASQGQGEKVRHQRPTLDDTVHARFSHAAEDTEKVVTSSVQAERPSL